MVERGGPGKIINISSIWGKRGNTRLAAYCASKFAIIGFTQSLALELAPYKINVNAICPGLVDTERMLGMASGAKPEGTTVEEFRDQMRENYARSNPLGRLAQAHDIARTAAFLASAESDYLTGLAVTVAGGVVMD
jgi:NAD(P)-dependent dehydrogenase (short-subunit alcohol dehydrogenase family)